MSKKTVMFVTVTRQLEDENVLTQMMPDFSADYKTEANKEKYLPGKIEEWRGNAVNSATTAHIQSLSYKIWDHGEQKFQVLEESTGATMGTMGATDMSEAEIIATFSKLSAEQPVVVLFNAPKFDLFKFMMRRSWKANVDIADLAKTRFLDLRACWVMDPTASSSITSETVTKFFGLPKATNASEFLDNCVKIAIQLQILHFTETADGRTIFIGFNA